MGLKMTVRNIKKNFNLNYLFMVLVALVFSIMTIFTQNAPEIIMGYSYSQFLLKNIVFMFIVFSYELSKDTLQAEKISKRLEWYLANNIGIYPIVVSYALTTFIMAGMLTLPVVAWISYTSKISMIVPIGKYIISILFYSFLLNIMILNTVNMNRFKGIQIKLISMNLLIIVIEVLVNHLKINLNAEILGYVVLLFTIIIISIRTTKERIVTSYY